jgi:hypothetical protein
MPSGFHVQPTLVKKVRVVVNVFTMNPISISMRLEGKEPSAYLHDGTCHNHVYIREDFKKLDSSAVNAETHAKE